MNMKDKIDHFLTILSELTKEEAFLIEMALKWDSETQAAFMFAKKIFDEEIEENG
jgi:hypothetical protein